jgi:peptidyl-prolyl cis-trans isomerase D
MLQSMRSSAKYIWWFVAATFLIGFVFYQQSGLSDRVVTAGTTVAKIDGTAITYDQYNRSVRAKVQEEQQRSGRTLNADQERQVAEQVFNEMVGEVLLTQEFKKRGITVSEDEIRQAALEQPYPQLARDPQFQTEGRFDIQKYQRYLASPQAKQQGVLVLLEDYYRQALLKSKLYEQIATSIYVPDDQLWRLWRDTRDSAKVTYVAFPATLIPDSAVKVTDAEISTYFEAHKKELSDLPGHAVLSVARLARTISAADSATARNKAEALRTEIAKGAKFDDVARRESADTGSASQGGALGKVSRGATVKEFDAVVFTIKVGELSQPVLSPFGYHIIRVDDRKGDTATVHHILVPIKQNDSLATATDRKADQLAKAAGTARPATLDSVGKQLGLEMGTATATEGAAVMFLGHYVPGASSWAFDGAKVGDVGEIIDADDAYYMVRLDSPSGGGKPTLDGLRTEIRTLLARQKKLDLLIPKAQQLTTAIAGGTSFEKAATAIGLVPAPTPLFTRTSQVPGLGQGNEAIGASFAIPVGTISQPVKAVSSVVVLRVDARHLADSVIWDKQKALQRDQVQQSIRQRAIQQYIQNLRENAKVVDDRKQLLYQQRQPTS